MLNFDDTLVYLFCVSMLFFFVMADSKGRIVMGLILIFYGFIFGFFGGE